MQWTMGRAVAAGVGSMVVLATIGNLAGDPNGGAGEADAGGTAGLAQRDGGAGASDVAGGAGGADAGAAADGSADAAVPSPYLELEVPDDRDVYRDQVTLTGVVRARDGGTVSGTRVTVGGKTAPVAAGGRWRKTVTVHAGGNTITVRAEKPGYEADESELTLTRKRSQAERAALAQRRAAEAAARKQAYFAGAKLLPYNQLEKNPDAHVGERVKFTGQIFQIQEDLGASVILLSVTDEGYGFWTDNIWVDYPGTIKGAEDDIITVYGTIEGSKSYETQIGGETYVPQMTAKYVVE
jgi:Glucodextranase, domain B